jgi:putative FmdB family regulatory protein
MPHYEYECQKCGHHFEVFQSMNDPKLDTCPKCGGKVTRLIGPGAGIVFKGSGFYQTDYRSESYKKKAKSEGGSGSTSKPESTSKAEPAPASPPPKPEPAPVKPAESKTKKKGGESASA